MYVHFSVDHLHNARASLHIENVFVVLPSDQFITVFFRRYLDEGKGRRVFLLRHFYALLLILELVFSFFVTTLQRPKLNERSGKIRRLQESPARK